MAKQALDGLRKATRERGRDPQYLEIYKCPFCQWFHIGNNHKKRKRKEGKR